MMSSGIQLTHPGLLDTTPTFQRGIFEFFNLKNSTEFRATILNFIVIMWFLCSTCHSSFTKRANLKRHIKSAHLNVRFICDVCQSEFKRKEYLTRHMRSAHPCVTDVTQPEHKNLLSPSTSHWDPTSDFNLDTSHFPLWWNPLRKFNQNYKVFTVLTSVERKQPVARLTEASHPGNCLLNTNTAALHLFYLRIERFRKNPSWSPLAHLLTSRCRITMLSPWKSLLWPTRQELLS